MKVVVMTRDWKGNYDDMKAAKGMILVGGENEIETGSDCYAMVFADKPTKIKPQKLYDMWDDIQCEEECEGCTAIDDDTIEVEEHEVG